jgi:hypothetical protein
MEIPVLIEPVAGNGYRATGGSPFAVTAEGATREEALGKLRELIQHKLAGGAELVRLPVGPEEHPWAKFAGTLRADDPMVKEWRQAMEEYRQKMDEDPDVP